jgi:hypothetical protein
VGLFYYFCGMTKKDIIPFHNELNLLIEEYCNLAWQSNEGGKRRKIMGDLGEKISHKIFEYCLSSLQINNSRVYRGDDKKIMCKIDDEAYFEAQVDKHVEIDDDLRIICEAKTYLDKTYVERASSDFNIIRKYNTNNDKKIFSYIISLQDCVKKETLNFFMRDGHIDNVFILMDIKRSGIKPIWDPNFRKTINLDKLYNCIYTITNNLSNGI